jgi:hypothetical protein
MTSTTGVQVGRTITSGGFPVNAAGTATVSSALANYPSAVVTNFNSNLTPNLHMRAYGQNRPGGGATTAPNATVYIEGARGTAASPTAIQLNDSIGSFSVMGYDGANWPADQNSGSYNLINFYATENMTFVGTTTYQAGAGLNIFLQPQWTRPGFTATRQRMLLTTWTTSSTAPSQLNILMGSGTDSTAPTMTMVDGTTYTGYGRTNFTEINTVHQFMGVPAQDTAPDNASLTATVLLNFIGNRRSGVAGRRNQIQTGDDLGVIVFRGQNLNNSTGVGLRGAAIFANALEAFTATQYGTALGFRTVNTGTTTESERLFLSDRINRYRADTHNFASTSGLNTFTFSSAGLTFPNGTIQTTAATGALQYAVIVDDNNSFSWTSANADTYEGPADLILLEQTDASGIVTVSADTFTLGAGTYDITVMLRGLSMSTSGSTSPPRLGWRLFNTTDSTVVDEYSTNNDWNLVFNSGSGRSVSFEPQALTNIVVLTGTKTFQIQAKRAASAWVINSTSLYGDTLKIKIVKLA